MVEKFFTPKEATKTLPLVKKTVEDILSHAQEARAIINSEISKAHEARLIFIDQRIKELMVQLEDIGCYYKDWNFEIGLVDFPAIIHGELALLCWRSDEPAIEWFHGYEDGYVGRRPITKELIFS